MPSNRKRSCDFQGEVVSGRANKKGLKRESTSEDKVLSGREMKKGAVNVYESLGCVAVCCATDRRRRAYGTS
jgi:hypothetical protein